MNNDYEFEKNLLVSTGHITAEDNEALTGYFLWPDNPGSELSIPGHAFEYGWYIYVDFVTNCFKQSGFSDELIKLHDIARDHQCRFLILDCDGPYYDHLPQFDW